MPARALSGFSIIESFFMLICITVILWLTLALLKHDKMWPFEKGKNAENANG